MYSVDEEKYFYDKAKRVLSSLDKENNKDIDVELLKKIISYADWKYYIKNSPILSDFEYDSLFKKLIQIEKENPEFLTLDSPTQRVANGLSERFPAVKHLVSMLSLDNTYNADDLADWDRRCKELTGMKEIEYCVEPKYDGASISLIYENGYLTRGATRGDGTSGEKVTNNIRQIREIPLSANFLEFGVEKIEIRGEVVIHKDAFTAYNKHRLSEGLEPLANPRNAASGTLRMLDPREVKKRGLSAILYHVSFHQEKSGYANALNSHFGTIQWLNKIGLPTPAREMKLFSSIEEVVNFCHEFEKHRDELPFEVDGLVIKVNDISKQEELGSTSHHPRWAVAYKFKARQATSKLLKVEFQVGRTGTITPVAKIEPVAIGGVTVSSVSLFNEDIIREKDIRVGDTVLVERAGDVIPYIVKALTELRAGQEALIQFPTHCPACDSLLEKQAELVALRCTNPKCKVQQIEKIIFFSSKDAMDIRSLGNANVQKFYELGILKDISGIYDIDWRKVQGLEGFGEKSVANLKQAIEQSKKQPLYRLILGLGIRYVGEATAKTIANGIANIKDLYSWEVEKLTTLEDVGPKVAASVHDFFLDVENRKLIDNLESFGVNLCNNESENNNSSDGKLNGKTFLFTGTLKSMKRNEAEKIVEQNGGKILNSVNDKLNYLVVGEDAGSKLEKAKKNKNIKILNEEEFLIEVK